MKPRAKSKGQPAKTAEILLSEVLACEPHINPKDMEKVADLVFSKEFIIRAWRCGVLVASKDGKFFKQIAEDTDLAKSFAAVVGSLGACATRLRLVADALDVAQSRLLVAGSCHESFIEWMGEPA